MPYVPVIYRLELLNTEHHSKRTCLLDSLQSPRNFAAKYMMLQKLYYTVFPLLECLFYQEELHRTALFDSFLSKMTNAM
ncbi:MAG: hypothetical protein Kow00108_23590 [Calditrichia bacterium]